MNLFEFGTKNEETLRNYLRNLKPTDEFEIRFGSFIYDHNTKKSNFESTIETESFYRLKQYLDSAPTFTKTQLYTKEMSFKNNFGKGNIKQILHYENNSFDKVEKEEFILKNKYNTFDIYDYNFRYSLSSEKNMYKHDLKGINLSEPQCVRIKTRYTYVCKYGKYDLTIVHQATQATQATQGRNLQTYEVEIEVNNTVNYQELYNGIYDMLMLVLQTRQNNHYIINSKEKYQTFLNYKELTRGSHFIGAQPETLQKDQLVLLYKNLYSVTDKADGERYFLFIDKNGLVYFIDSNIHHIIKTNLYSKKYHNVIMDGELIRSTKMYFYAFDILFYNGYDLRGDQKYLLKQRVNKMLDIISCIENNDVNNLYYFVQAKKFIYHNVFVGSDIILNDIPNKPYKNDGLIFTPMNEPYPKNKKWSTLFKWKPSELNTIDFYAVKKINNTWELYVQTYGNHPTNVENQTYSNVTNKMLFDVSKLCDVQSERQKVTYETTFDDNLIDPTTNEPFKTNTVIEFSWDHFLNKFVPLRTRWDKTMNPKKHGNFYSVASNIWNNIHNPVKIETLLSLKNVSTKQLDDSSFFFEKMNRFETYIKEYLYSKYHQSTSSLLEIFNNEQFKYFKNISNQKYEHIKLNEELFSECIHLVKHKIKKVDHIYIHDLNYFNSSKNNLDILFDIFDYTLNDNGTITFKFIETYFKNSPLVIKDNEIMYYSKQENSNTFKLFVNRPNKIYKKELYTVHCIEYDKINNMMNEHGYYCEETDLFSNLYKNIHQLKLEPYEENLIELYRFCVFKRKNPTSPTDAPDKTQIVNLKPIIQTHNVHHKMKIVSEFIKVNKDVELIQITTNYDIYNILNCIHYKYYINNYPMINIMSFEDISAIMNNTDKEYILLNKDLVVKKSFIAFYIDDSNTTDAYYIVIYKNKIIQTDQSDLLTTIQNLKHIQENYKQEIEQNKQGEESNASEESNTSNASNESNASNTSNKSNASNESNESNESNASNASNKSNKSNASLRMELVKMKEQGIRITIKVLKDMLSECKLKTSGKKDELVERLYSHIGLDII